MGMVAWIIGLLGGLAAIWGGLIAFDVLPASVTDALKADWTFWFYAAIVLLLGAIALKGAGTGGGVD